jgi:arsenical pump membrane protein
MIAGAAVVAVVGWPRSRLSIVALAAGAVVVTALYGSHPLRVAFGATLPVFVFLAAALSLSSLVAGAGLTAQAADWLARAARGRALRLYAGVCALTALLTLALSLDGAVVLVAPTLIELHSRFRMPLAPYLLGAIGVANAFPRRFRRATRPISCSCSGWD